MPSSFAQRLFQLHALLAAINGSVCLYGGVFSPRGIAVLYMGPTVAQDSELVLGHLLRNTACLCFTFLAVNIMALRERHLSTTASRTVVAVNILGHAHYFSEVFVFGALQPLVMATMFIFMIVDLRQTWHIYSGHDKRSS